ncbi:MAG: hypothetical protein J0L83_14595 [Chitinophagales bacterium]|nr:hypothetical protein [Chitinophagales bacterium]
MGLTVAAIIAQFGAHYINEGQNLSNVNKLLYAKDRTLGMFRTIPQDNTYYKTTSAMMGEVLQAFQKGFTAKGALEFKPHGFEVEHQKIDLELFPDEIEESYLGFLANVDVAARAEWPIVRYLIEQHILDARNRDLEKKAAFGGVYQDPVAGTAGAAENALTGIKKRIVDLNATGRTNMGAGPLQFETPAEDPKDFCEQVEKWVESMDEELRDEITEICMSTTLAARYGRGKRAKYGQNVNFVEGGKNVIEDYPTISVVGLPNHKGSNLIWATPANNRIKVVKKLNMADVFKVEEAKRAVAVMADWWMSIHFAVPELLVHNEFVD